MKPTSTKPRWARRKASVIPGSIVARRPARISLVEIGSRPGAISGPMMPPSMTRVSRGAWRCRARAAARSGTPTPAKTVVSSRSSRAATTARSSDAVTGARGVILAGSARPAHTVGGLSEVHGASFARELARPALLEREPLAAEEVEVVAPRGGGVGVALEVIGHGVRPARVDRPRVVREVVEVRLVEAVALVGERAERRQHEGVDDEARDHGALG